MTALKKYQQLEAMGLWRQSNNPQRIEVVVCIGKSSLVLSDIQNHPLAHWSLGTIERIKRTRNGVIFSPTPEGHETLEITDPLMIEAIAYIQRKIEARRAHPGRLRRYFLAMVLTVLLAALGFYLPSSMARYAASIMPDAKAKTIGKLMQSNLEQIIGPICDTAQTRLILSSLNTRLKLPSTHRIHIANLGDRSAISLIGDISLINADLLRAKDNVAELMAGYILALRAKQKTLSDTQALFEAMAFADVMKFLGNGTIALARIEDFSDSLLLAPEIAPNPVDLETYFTIAEVPISPYARHAGLSLPDIGSDEGDFAVIMTATEIGALQNACLLQVR